MSPAGFALSLPPLRFFLLLSLSLLLLMLHSADLMGGILGNGLSFSSSSVSDSVEELFGVSVSSSSLSASSGSSVKSKLPQTNISLLRDIFRSPLSSLSPPLSLDQLKKATEHIKIFPSSPFLPSLISSCNASGNRLLSLSNWKRFRTFPIDRMKNAIVWERPREGGRRKHLLMWCTYGQVSNREVCATRYVRVAALLSRSLVIDFDPSHVVNGYDRSLFLSLQHLKDCYGEDSVISLEEYRAERAREDGREGRERGGEESEGERNEEGSSSLGRCSEWEEEEEGKVVTEDDTLPLGIVPCMMKRDEDGGERGRGDEEFSPIMYPNISFRMLGLKLSGESERRKEERMKMSKAESRKRQSTARRKVLETTSSSPPLPPDFFPPFSSLSFAETQRHQLEIERKLRDNCSLHSIKTFLSLQEAPRLSEEVEKRSPEDDKAKDDNSALDLITLGDLFHKKHFAEGPQPIPRLPGCPNLLTVQPHPLSFFLALKFMRDRMGVVLTKKGKEEHAEGEGKGRDGVGFLTFQRFAELFGLAKRVKRFDGHSVLLNLSGIEEWGVVEEEEQGERRKEDEGENEIEGGNGRGERERLNVALPSVVGEGGGIRREDVQMQRSVERRMLLNLDSVERESESGYGASDSTSLGAVPSTQKQGETEKVSDSGDEGELGVERKEGKKEEEEESEDSRLESSRVEGRGINTTPPSFLSPVSPRSSRSLSNFMCAHWRRGDFKPNCIERWKVTGCWLSQSDVASCIASAARRAQDRWRREEGEGEMVRGAESGGSSRRLDAVLLVTNERGEQVKELLAERLRKSLGVETVFLSDEVKEFLPEGALNGVSEEALLELRVLVEKIVCSSAKLFQGTLRSTFSKDIQRLRYALGTASCDDSFICDEEISTSQILENDLTFEEEKT